MHMHAAHATGRGGWASLFVFRVVRVMWGMVQSMCYVL